MYSRFGPCSALYAASAWSMSKRKSWRPWIRSVGVVIVGSFASGERVDASVAAAERSALEASPADAASSCGSHRLVGTSPARYCTSPDFERPCGASDVSRFVHVMIGTAALNGTPARERVPDGAAAERDAERADVRVAELSGEPREELLRVLHVAQPVETEEPLRGPVAARVALERLVAGRSEELLRDRLHVLMLAAEAVEEDHAGPRRERNVAGRRRRARELARRPTSSASAA